MKKFIASLFILSIIFGWTSPAEKPVLDNGRFNPFYYILKKQTPLFVILAHPSQSYEVGVSNHAQVWTSDKIDDSTYAITGVREFQHRVPDSAIERNFVTGKFDTIRFFSIYLEHKYMMWTDHIIGSGSGSVSITSQGTYATSGDRALIVAGTYTGGGNFYNFKGITVLPQTIGHTVFFTTAEGSIRNVDSAAFLSLSYYGISGSAIDMRYYTGGGANGPIKHTLLQDISFSGITGACIDANGGGLYTGDTTNTAEWLDNTLDSINEDQCGLLYQGSFGAPTDNSGQPNAFMLRTTISNFISTGTTSTTNRGTEGRGQSFESLDYNWIVVDTSGLGNSGDCGLKYGHGSGTMHHVIKIGPGPGYLWRSSPTAEVGRPGIDYFWDCFKFYTTDYGMFQCQNPDSVTGHFRAIDEMWVTHCTAGRMMSDNNYWCQLVVVGDLRTTGASAVTIRFHEKNCFAFEVTDHANSDAGHDNGTYTIRLFFNMGVAFTYDTSNNQYFPTLAAANMDTTQYRMINGYRIPQINPKSTSAGNIVNGGVAESITTADYNGVTWASPIPIGYLNVGNYTPPVNTTISRGFKLSKKH